MRHVLLSLLVTVVGTTSGVAQAEPKRDVHGLVPGMTVDEVIARLKEIGVGPNLYFVTEDHDGWHVFRRVHQVDPEEVAELRKMGCISGTGGKEESATEVTCYNGRDFYTLVFTRYLTSTHLKRVSHNFPTNIQSGKMLKDLRHQYRLGKAKADDYNRFDLGDGYKLTVRQRQITKRSEVTITSTHLWVVDANARDLERRKSNPEPTTPSDASPGSLSPLAYDPGPGPEP